MRRVHVICRVIGSLFSVYAACLVADTAGAQHAPGSDAALAQELSNPIGSLISVPLQTNWDDGYGTGDGSKVFTNFQPVVPVPLNPDWNLISRTIVPVVWDQNEISPLGPSGNQTGFSDITQSFFFSPKQAVSTKLGNFVWGAGPVLTLPTGNADPLLGTGKWGVGPTAVALFIKGHWTYGMLANQVWDYAGKSNRADVNQTFLQPFVAYTTPNAWTFLLNSESTYNYVAEDWSIPINFWARKLTSIGEQKVSIGAGLRYWAASPTAGPDDLGVRAEMVFLFPE
jgi:hypothetical protein